MNIGEWSPRRSRGDYSPIVTEPEVTNCFSKIALVLFEKIEQEQKFETPKRQQNLAAILKTESRRCYNHQAVIIATEN